MTNTLNIMLGAGFSFHAKVPLVYGITARFCRDNKDKILRQSSLEWQWLDDKNDPSINNGKLGFDYLAGGYILNQVVSDYISYAGKFENYEIFFQYVLHKLTENSSWIKDIFSQALETLEEDCKNLDDGYKRMLKTPNPLDLINLLSELLSDMISVKGNDIEIALKYQPFLGFVKSYETINIFSLNHDTFLEDLLKYSGIEYTDGFTTDNSDIRFEGKSQRKYNGFFNDSGIRIFKLHGSKDIIDFEVMNQNGCLLKRTGESIYFKPDNYYAKHRSLRINLTTKEVIQNFQPNISPFFVTGVNKLDLIKKNYMFKELFEHFTTNLDAKSDLLIIGYSFSDEHINGLIYKNVEKNSPLLINVNPVDKYINSVYENLIELNDITEL